MNVSYDSLITKIKDVRFPTDEQSIVKMIGERRGQGRSVIAKIKYDDDSKNERQYSDVDFEKLSSKLISDGYDLNRSFLVSIIVRDPTTFKARNVETPPGEDRNDINTLHWAGERGIGSSIDHGMRSSPMFLREDGSSIDLVGLYSGRSAFLVLNGPSLKETLRIYGDDLKKPGVITFGVNNGAQVFRPNMWSCVDSPYRFCESIWNDPVITKFVPMAHFYKRVWDVKNDRYGRLVREHPNVIGYRRNEFFRADRFFTENTINWGNHKDRGGGRSVMMASIRILHLLGFSKVYLLGCDFEMTDDKRYFFEEDRSNGAISNNNNSYQIMMGYFKELMPHLVENRFQILNCNLSSKLDVFPKYDINEALHEVFVDTSAPTLGMYVDEKTRLATAR